MNSIQNLMDFKTLEKNAPIKRVAVQTDLDLQTLKVWEDCPNLR